MGVLLVSLTSCNLPGRVNILFQWHTFRERLGGVKLKRATQGQIQRENLPETLSISFRGIYEPI